MYACPPRVWQSGSSIWLGWRSNARYKKGHNVIKGKEGLTKRWERKARQDKVYKVNMAVR